MLANTKKADGKKRKKSKAEPAPPPPPEDDDEDDEDENDDDDEDDSEDEAISLEQAESKPSVSVDFGFFDPKPSDFHGLRALLTGGGGALLPAGASYDVGGLAGVLCEQAAVGSVAKVLAPGSEEAADPDDVLGFMSCVSLHAHRDAAFAKELVASFSSRCLDASDRVKVQELLTSQASSGLILSCRMLNLPPALVPSLVDSLLQDLAWAVENSDDAAERASFGALTSLVLICHVELGSDGAAGSSSAAGGSSAAGEADGGGGGGKKKKKARRAEASAAAMEGLVFARPEEEVLAAAAEWSTLLGGAGKSRQLLCKLTPSAIKAAVPALHAIMQE